MSRHAKDALKERYTADFNDGIEKLDAVLAECRRVLDVVTGPWDGKLPEPDEETGLPASLDDE